MIHWLLAVALADPSPELVHQRQVVEQAAAAAARARADGARAEVAQRMAEYRAAAAELERMEAAAGPSSEEAQARRAAAVSALTRALAEAGRAPDARAVLVEWLGDPEAHVELLEAAVAAAPTVPVDLRAAWLWDVVEQSDALALVLDFDAAEADRAQDQLELRALGLRRQGPGQAASITAEVEAVRLDAAAAAEQRREQALRTLRARVERVRQQAVTALESP